MKHLYFALSLTLWLPLQGYGWGELGHHIVGRTAAKLIRVHPETKGLGNKVPPFVTRNIQQGHVANIPDIHWRNYEDGLEAEVKLLGDETHFLNPEPFVTVPPSQWIKFALPLDFDEAKKALVKNKPGAFFFKEFGTGPWRANQFAQLYSYTMSNYPNKPCQELDSVENHPTRSALTYAALMSHFTGDAAQPLHNTVDYDGQSTGQKGLHSFFETTLVDALEDTNLAADVATAATDLLFAKATLQGSVAWIRKQATDLYPGLKENEDVTALVWILASDGYQYLSALRQMDETYGLATLREALEIPSCQTLPAVLSLKASLEKATTAAQKEKILSTKVKSGTAFAKGDLACRRSPFTKVDADGKPSTTGKLVSQYFRGLIVQRLAIASALTADIWAKKWVDAGSPSLCFTWKYATKPSFVSPTDPKCFGYALNEDPKDFVTASGKTALPWKESATTKGDCLRF